ncbi:hypothetical protein FB45DRAFT_916620 [Roridomyces roridus]|uniref:EKC/KEOPS complex subunit GON7 n=1 Tax=Roridomyces roridus TaxID=1738132 RepID=A0AAD7BV87_9AGAR|nr:hypothetical protein FB45DRAFT_916620 [Roridomyces roridus]
MAHALTVEYKLNPPSSQSHDLPASKQHSFQVRDEAGNPNYYKSLREALASAKDEVGEALTVWRDAVGKAELSKESKKSSEEDEEEEEEEGDA